MNTLNNVILNIINSTAGILEEPCVFNVMHRHIWSDLFLNASIFISSEKAKS